MCGAGNRDQMQVFISKVAGVPPVSRRCPADVPPAFGLKRVDKAANLPQIKETGDRSRCWGENPHRDRWGAVKTGLSAIFGASLHIWLPISPVSGGTARATPVVCSFCGKSTWLTRFAFQFWHEIFGSSMNCHFVHGFRPASWACDESEYVRCNDAERSPLPSPFHAVLSISSRLQMLDGGGVGRRSGASGHAASSALAIMAFLRMRSGHSTNAETWACVCIHNQRESRNPTAWHCEVACELYIGCACWQRSCFQD